MLHSSRIKTILTSVCFLQTLLVTVFCFVFTYLHFGFYFSDYEALFDSFHSGSLTEGMPFRSMYFLGHIGLSYFYSLLFEWLPWVEWMSTIQYLYLFVSCFILLYIIYKVCPASWSWRKRVFMQLFLYLLVFADQNIHLLYTRTSYFLAGSSLIAIFFFFREYGTVRKRPLLFIFLNILFLLGALTRIESAWLIFFQIFGFGFYYVSDKKQVAIVSISPFLFLITAVTIISIDIKNATDFYKQIEPNIEVQFSERDNMVPLEQMKTAEDSAKWQMAKTIVWSDPQVITPDYLRSLILPEEPIYSNKKQWTRAIGDTWSVVVRFYPLVWISIILSIVILAFRDGKKSWGKIIPLFFIFSFWIIILVQAYIFKVNDRSFNPPISLFVFSLIVPVIERYKEIKHWHVVIILLVGFLGCLHISYLEKESTELKRAFIIYETTLNKIKKVAKDKILVTNGATCDYIFWTNKPFKRFDYSVFKKLYIVDGFNMPFLPYYRKYLEKECNCNIEKFPSFWDYLRKNNEDVIVFSSQERIEIIREYFKVVRHDNLPLTLDTTVQLKPLTRNESRGIYFDAAVYQLGK